MAIDIVQVGDKLNSPYIKQFAIDTAEDVAKLPTQTTEGTWDEKLEIGKVDTGSTAITADGEVFYLFPSGWAEL